MTAPILTLAEVQALSGFTEGPWEWGGTDRERFMVPGLVTPRGLYIVTAWTRTSPVEVKPAVPVDARLIAAAPALHATCEHLFREVARLTAELEKPVAKEWKQRGLIWDRDCGDAMAVAVSPHGWRIWALDMNCREVAHGPETGDAGKRAADRALVAAGYRLVGGVFGEVSEPKPVPRAHKWKMLTGGGADDDGRSDVVCEVCGAEPDDGEVCDG